MLIDVRKYYLSRLWDGAQLRNKLGNCGASPILDRQLDGSGKVVIRVGSITSRIIRFPRSLGIVCNSNVLIDGYTEPDQGSPANFLDADYGMALQV